MVLSEMQNSAIGSGMINQIGKIFRLKGKLGSYGCNFVHYFKQRKHHVKQETDIYNHLR